MLPPPAVKRIAGSARIVLLDPDSTLFDAGDTLDSVYFPLLGVVSLDQPLTDAGAVGIERVLARKPRSTALASASKARRGASMRRQSATSSAAPACCTG